jgi:hypothetical protein
LVEKLQPAAPTAESVYIAAFAGAFTLTGVALLWVRRYKTGSLLLMAALEVAGLAFSGRMLAARPTAGA